jgi:hypothetical protein
MLRAFLNGGRGSCRNANRHWLQAKEFSSKLWLFCAVAIGKLRCMQSANKYSKSPQMAVHQPPRVATSLTGRSAWTRCATEKYVQCLAALIAHIFRPHNGPANA